MINKEIKKILKLKFNIPEKVLQDRKKAKEEKITIPAGKNLLNKVPDECLCDICKNILEKPYLVTCCNSTICNI